MKTPTAVEMSEKTKNQCNGVAGQAASTQMLEKIRKIEDVIEDDESECPLCMEPFEIDDIDFFPCSCGYQVCRFCWHRLKDEESGLCPACRQTYPELPVHFSTISIERVEEIKKEKKKQKEKSKSKDNNKMANLATIRVVQKNLLFVIGFSSRISQDDLRKEFLKYGKIIKMVINPSSAYVTYTRAEDAVMAIKALNESNMINGKCNGGGPKGTGQTIRASLGTTKYCSHWLRSQACPKQPDCMYLHENADQEASFTKEQMQLGKHTEYEKRLITHYTELLRKKDERTLNVNEKNILKASVLDCSNKPLTLVDSLNGDSSRLNKKKEIGKFKENDKKSSSMKISKSRSDEDSEDSSSSGNSSLSSSPAQNDVGSTFANYCPSSGVSSLNLCENTSDSLISSSSSGNSSKSSTPDNVQQQQKNNSNNIIQPSADCSLSNGQSQQQQTSLQQQQQQQQSLQTQTSGHHNDCKTEEIPESMDDKDDDDLDFDPIRFTLDDMLKSMSMSENRSQNSSNPQMRLNNVNNNCYTSSSSSFSLGQSGNNFDNGFSPFRMHNNVSSTSSTSSSLFGGNSSQSPSLSRLFESANRQQQHQHQQQQTSPRNDALDMLRAGRESSMFMNSSKMMHERDLNSFFFNQDALSSDSFDLHRQRMFQQQQQQQQQHQMKPNMGVQHQQQQNSLRQLLPNVNINFRQANEDSFGFSGLVQQQQQQQPHNHPSLSPTSLAAANSFFGANSSSMRQNSFNGNSMGSMNGFGSSSNNGMNNSPLFAQQQYIMQRYQQQQQQQQQQQRNTTLMQQMMAMGGGNNGSSFSMNQQCAAAGLNQRQQAPPGF